MKNKILVVILLILVIALGVLIGMKYINKDEVANNNLEENVNGVIQEEQEVEQEQEKVSVQNAEN